MIWIEWVAIGIGVGIVLLAVGAWGVVQVLDIMEALDLRRAERARQLERARQFLRDPQNHPMPDNVQVPYTGPSTGTATWPGPQQHPTWTSGTSGNVSQTKLVNLNNMIRTN